MSSISILGDTSGSVLLQAPAVSGSTTLTLPATTGTVLASGSTGVCRAWAQFTVSGTTLTMNKSFNVASITRTAAGRYYVDFTTAMPDANYSAVGSASVDTSSGTYLAFIFTGTATPPYYTAPTTTRFYFSTAALSTGAGYDPFFGTFAVFD
jgi:hypothetical protein